MNNIPVYINGLGTVSPQKPTGFLEEPLFYESRQLRCIDPRYKEFVPAEMLRRMGRIIKMGVAASKLCLKDAEKGTEKPLPGALVPDAIITGTGLGCIEDTEKFLTSMIGNSEEFLTPTSFIQSTHNTVAGQIALLLKCHGYNFTYVHRGISFESALIDAKMQIAMGEVRNVLAGGSDELTLNSFAITGRLGYWKRNPVNTMHLLDDLQRGSVAGEGASFFFLENQKNHNTYARLAGVSAFLKPGSDQVVSDRLHEFLASHGLSAHDIDLVILGLNGDPRTDQVYHHLAGSDFPGTPRACFKHLCGEYHTASAYATWVGAKVLREQTIPYVIRARGADSMDPSRTAWQEKPRLENLLIYNHYQGNNHAFILLSRS